MTYQSLFGMEGPIDSGVTDVAEHGRVGNVSTGQPFKYVSTIDATTGLPTSGGDGAILDGVSSSIKATVRDYTNSNPIAVALTDANGDFTSAGAGTQYTEDAVAAANPIGTAVNLIRQDTPGALVTTDGDNVAQRGTNYGAAYTQVVTSAGAFVDTFGGGTQYADGAVRGTATGTLAMGDDGTNIQSIKVDAAGELQIDVLTLPAISGTVTANLSATDNAVLDAIESDTTQIASIIQGATDSFGHIITGELNNDIDVQFYRATSDADLSNIITETEANGGTASKSNGMATFATTTTSNSRAKGVSLVPVTYTAGSEVYMIFTAAFPTATGGTASYRRIGLYNDYTDGFFIGYETTGTFGITLLKGTSPTTTLKASFSVDTLVGGAGSLFTRGGTPEAIDLTKLNVFRIRFGWVGSAPIEFEVLSPDGNWVIFHTIKQPNLAALPSINTADLYATCDVATGTSGNAQSILTNCWGAGTTQKLRKLSDTLNVNTLAGLTRSVITGYSTAGGGAFVNVKANPSGALTVDATATDLDIRNLTFAADKVDASGSTGVGVTGTFFQATQPVSLASVPSHAVTNAGTFAVQQTTYSTSSVTQVTSSATSVQLLASTAGRRGAYFFNDSTAIAYIKLGTTSATNSYTIKMAAGSFYELPYPCYTGRIDCIWSSANGVMAITEIT